jgi:hypothetical protein
MSQYPITHLPQAIKEALSKQPTIPVFKESYPLNSLLPATHGKVGKSLGL